MSPSISIRLLSAQSDTRLVELARAGHERAFEALVLRYRRPLLRYCRRLLLRDERAEEAMQQGLLQAWLALRDGTEVREVKPWLYRIVHNAALNTLRVSGYDYTSLSDTLQGADAPEDDLDRRIAIREAFAGLATLPEMQREALLRTAVDGHSHEEVARALGLSEGALRGLIYRARVSLRTAATALTPSPTLSWALGHRTPVPAPLTIRVAELATSGGSVGVGGLLLKGGAVVVSAGALAGGITAVHHHRHAKPRATQLVAQQTAGSLSASAPDGSLPSLRPPSSVGPRDGAAAPSRHGPATHSAAAFVVVRGRPKEGPPEIGSHGPVSPAHSGSPEQRSGGQSHDSQPTSSGGGIPEVSSRGDTKATSDGGSGSGSSSGPSDGSSGSGSSEKSGASSTGTGSLTSSSDSGSGGSSSTNDSSGSSGSVATPNFSGGSDGGLVSEPTLDGQTSTDGSSLSGSGSSSSDGGSSSTTTN